MREFACYFSDCYIGRMIFYDNSEKEFIAENKENYTEGASNFVKYMPLSTTSDIDVFISERVIKPERPDRSMWLSLIGCTIYDSDLTIFIKNNGRSCNDLFWLKEI